MYIGKKFSVKNYENFKKMTSQRLTLIIFIILHAGKNISAFPASSGVKDTSPNKCETITIREQCPELKYNLTASTDFAARHGSLLDISKTAQEMVRN